MRLKCKGWRKSEMEKDETATQADFKQRRRCKKETEEVEAAKR
jgi:hypothetical protein